MKVRIVVTSLIFVAFWAVACSGDPSTVDESRPDNKNVSAANDNVAKSELKTELMEAAKLIDKAKSELGDDAQPNAMRTLGYPVFLISDFKKPQSFVSKFDNNNRDPLSDYLVTNFKTLTKTLLKEEGNPPSEKLKNALKDEFNDQLRNKDLYEPARFPNVTRGTLSELDRNGGGVKRLQPEELAQMNRLLLQTSYEEFIEPAPTETVLHHLNKAATLAKPFPAAQVSLDETLTTTRALLRKRSEAEAPTLLSASEVDKVGDNIETVLASLARMNGTQTSTFNWITGVIWDVLYYLLLTLAVVIPVAIVGFFIKRARDKAAAKEHANLQVLKKLIDRNDHLQQEFTAFKSQNSSEIEALKDQVSRLESAYRLLARKNEQPAYSSTGHIPNINRYYEPSPAPVKEEPEFPVSAESYLEKVKGSNRFSTVIRPDFQNGILVKDSDGRGELVLIEDSTRSVDFQRLFVVPSVSQFQMKQDFYNYYDEYYECDQPTAGNVWIVHPAIVEKVNGGWRLMEKGRLEVRA
jgi:hypothetical protein